MQFIIKKNDFTNKLFDQIPFFAISKMAKNEFLNWGKLPKMQFHEKKKMIYLISRVFFLPGLF